MAIDSQSNPFHVALLVADTLESLGVQYFVTGSIASGLVGEPRSTNDIDFVVEMKAEHITPLLSAMKLDFYISESAVREAVQHRKSFNIVHTATVQKADLFVSAMDQYATEQMKRRRIVIVSKSPERGLHVASTEDILLSKLRWYREGGELSDRQWRDILGIVKVQSNLLDRNYLQKWAHHLMLSELLEKALSC